MAVAAPDGISDQRWDATSSWAPDPASTRIARKHGRRSQHRLGHHKPDKASKDSRKADAELIVPPGPLNIVVSIDKQRVTLFADGKPVTSSSISSGTPGHPTPMGVFSVIQKRRHHVSNLYDAQMPYMQRLTWSGTAMHQGPLPGRPASHGCIRLTDDFAQKLWKITSIGTRVIVTRDEVAPVEIDLPHLFAMKPKMAEAPPAATPAPALAPVRTADATSVLPGVVVRDVDAFIVPQPAANAVAPEQGTKASLGADGKLESFLPASPVAVSHAHANSDNAKSDSAKSDETPDRPAPVADEGPAAIEPAPAAAETKKRTGPISVFISRKEAKLYVRQKMEPLFETPVTIERADEPLGTHVYTAMGPKDDGTMRWTVVSVPSSTKQAPEPTKTKDGKKSRRGKPVEPAAEEIAEPAPSAHAALDRIVMPTEAIERISALMTAGSSLIVSDNRLSDETGESTDFIVLTP